MDDEQYFKNLLNKNQYDEKFIEIFERIKTQYPFGRLLLSHPDEVFPKIFQDADVPPGLNINLSYLYWTNYLDDDKRNIELDEEINQKENEEKYEYEDDNSKTEDNNNEDIVLKINELLRLIEDFFDRDLKRIASYSLVQVGRRTPELMECITSDSLDYKGFLEKTHGLEDIDPKVAFEDILSENTIENKELRLRIIEGDNIEERVLKKGIAEILSSILSDPLSLLKILRISIIWHIIIERGGLKTYFMLKKLNIEVKDYNRILKFLYKNGLIENYHSLIVCNECNENPFIMDFSAEINLLSRKIKCLVCKKETDLMSVFNPIIDLRQMIFSRDGLLSYYAGFFINNHYKNWSFSIYEGETECDFIIQYCEERIIIEVKMLNYPNEKNSDWKKYKVKIFKSLDQLMKKISVNDSIGILLLNLHSKDFYETPKMLLSEYGNGNNLKIVPYNQFEKEIKLLNRKMA